MRIYNFIATFFRNIILHRSISLLTLMGLSLGIAMGLLVLIYVYYESSYDRHLPSSENIFRLYSQGKIGDDTIRSALTPVPMVRETWSVPGIDHATRLMPGSRKIVENRYFISLESNFFYTDSNFFNVFNIPFLLGDAESAFKKENAAVITRSASQRLFGQRNPMGEILKLDNELEFEITGIIEDIPANTHFKFDILGNWPVVEQRILQDTGEGELTMMDNWLHLNSYTYYRISPESSSSAVFKELSQVANKKVESQISETFGNESQYPGHVHLNFEYMPIHDIHLHSNLDNEIQKGANSNFIKIFTGIAFLILLVTAINFMNLTTAKSSIRFKEVAMRKIYFARRRDIILQFMTEAVIYSFMALLVALVLVELFLPLFNHLFEIEMISGEFIRQPDVLWLIIISLIVGMISGSYPALFYSGLNPLSILQGANRIQKSGLIVRGLMVAIQVGLSLLLITLTLTIYGQYNFLIRSDHGFNTENTLVIERGVANHDELKEFSKELVDSGIADHAGIIQNIPGEDLNMISFRKTDPDEGVILLAVNYADAAFFKAIKTECIYGRTFHKSDTTHRSRAVINESAARLIHFDPEKLNQLELVGGRGSADINVFEIIGVINDMHFESKRNPSRPMIFMQSDQEATPGHIIVDPGHNSQTSALQEINHLWNNYFEGSIIQAYPLKILKDNFYSEEKRFARIGLMFSILAYLLALLGQIGMATFLIHYHQKNIYIKKILNAPIQRIVYDTFRDFGLFIFIGLLIAIPVTIIANHTWLSGFHSVFEPTIILYALPVLIILLTFCLVVFITGKREFQKQY